MPIDLYRPDVGENVYNKNRLAVSNEQDSVDVRQTVGESKLIDAVVSRNILHVNLNLLANR